MRGPRLNDRCAPVANRQNATREEASADILIYSQVENQHFRPAGATRCTDSCEIWRSRRAPGSDWPRKISHQSVPGVGKPPRNGKNLHFLVSSRSAGPNPFTDCYGLVYAQLSCISVSHLTGFASQFTELFLRNRASFIYSEFFRAPCRKKSCVGSKNGSNFFNGLGVVLSHRAKFGR